MGTLVVKVRTVGPTENWMSDRSYQPVRFEFLWKSVVSRGGKGNGYGQRHEWLHVLDCWGILLIVNKCFGRSRKHLSCFRLNIIGLRAYMQSYHIHISEPACSFLRLPVSEGWYWQTCKIKDSCMQIQTYFICLYRVSNKYRYMQIHTALSVFFLGQIQVNKTKHPCTGIHATHIYLYLK